MTAHASTFSILTELVVEERIYCPCYQLFIALQHQRKSWGVLQLNIFYHISLLKTLLAMKKATQFTSQEIKQWISGVYIDWLWLVWSLYKDQNENLSHAPRKADGSSISTRHSSWTTHNLSVSPPSAKWQVWHLASLAKYFMTHWWKTLQKALNSTSF